MKKIIICLLCAVLLISAASCSGSEPAMKLENVSVSGSIYAYYLACYKQYWLTAFGQTDGPDFWDAESDGIRNADRLTQISETAIKKRIAANYLFDLYQLKLTDEEYKSIDAMITGIKASVDDDIENDEMFKTLGMKTDDLKEILIIDSKVGALQDYLYGENGVRKITDDTKEAYYKDNYYRFKFVYLMGADFVRDENGDIVYNENGNARVDEISDERYEEKLDFAQEILRKVRGGEDIDGYIDEYSEELEKGDYKNGHYLCSVNEYGTLLSGAVMKLSVGETGLLDTKYGIYVIQRLGLDPGAWGNEENEAGNDFYNFEQLVLEKEFDDYLAPYMEKIEVDRAVTDKYKMEDLPYTFSWQYFF